MSKPAVTLKSTVQPQALTYQQLDDNFTNLRDATISLTAGTAGTAVVSDLNGNITLVAGTGVTLTGDNTAKTIVIDSSAGGNSYSTLVPDTGGTLTAAAPNSTLRVSTGPGLGTFGGTSVVNGVTVDNLLISVQAAQTVIQSVTNTTNGANINFPNGSIFISRYNLKRAADINNDAAAVVDISSAADSATLSSSTALRNAVSSVTVIVDAFIGGFDGLQPLLSVQKQKLVFTTDSAGGTFDIVVQDSDNNTVPTMFTDGIKTCDRDGTTYILEVHCITPTQTGRPHSQKYFMELLPYA